MTLCTLNIARTAVRRLTEGTVSNCEIRICDCITDGLINPNPYISKWGNCGDGTSPNGSKQTSMFAHYVVKAIEAWNHREEEADV